MSREYFIKRISNRIDLNQEAINGQTAADLRLVISNNNDLLRLIKTELESTENSENTENSDKTYEQGMHDIWELCRKLYCDPVFNKYTKREEIFGYEYISDILERLSPEAALE